MSNNYLKIDWRAMPAPVQQLHITKQPYGWLIRPLAADGENLTKSHELARCRALSFSSESCGNSDNRYGCVRLSRTEGEEMFVPRPKSSDIGQQLVEWWSRQPAWAKFAARDEHGDVFLYATRPELRSCSWVGKGARMEYVGPGERPPRVSEDWKLDITARPAVSAAPLDTVKVTYVGGGVGGGGSGIHVPRTQTGRDAAPNSDCESPFPHNAGEVARKVEETPALSAELAAIYLWWAGQPSWANYAVRDGAGFFEDRVFVTDKAPTYKETQEGARIWQMFGVKQVIRLCNDPSRRVVARNQCMARPEHWWATYAPAWARFAARGFSGAVYFFSSRPRWVPELGKWEVGDSDGPYRAELPSSEVSVTAPFALISAPESLIKRPDQVKKTVDPAKRAEAMQAMARVLKAVDREYYTMDTFLQHAATSFFRKSGQKVAHAVRSVEPEGVVLYKGGRVSYRDLGMYHERYDTAKGKWVPGYHFIEPTPAT